MNASYQASLVNRHIRRFTGLFAPCGTHYSPLACGASEQSGSRGDGHTGDSGTRTRRGPCLTGGSRGVRSGGETRTGDVVDGQVRSVTSELC